MQTFLQLGCFGQASLVYCRVPRLLLAFVNISDTAEIKMSTHTYMYALWIQQRFERLHTSSRVQVYDECDTSSMFLQPQG
jgi:hypothetical protein